MSKSFFLAAAFAVATTPAFAGNLTDPELEPTVTPDGAAPVMTAEEIAAATKATAGTTESQVVFWLTALALFGTAAAQ